MDTSNDLAGRVEISTFPFCDGAAGNAQNGHLNNLTRLRFSISNNRSHKTRERGHIVGFVDKTSKKRLLHQVPGGKLCFLPLFPPPSRHHQDLFPAQNPSKICFPPKISFPPDRPGKMCFPAISLNGRNSIRIWLVKDYSPINPGRTAIFSDWTTRQ